MSEKVIAEALGLRPLDEVIPKNEEKDISEMLPMVQGSDNLPEVKDTVGEEHLQDIEKARENIEEIIEHGKDSLATLVDLAKQSQSARAFEVVSTMMKTMLDANKEFVDMSTKRKYAKEDHGSAGTPGNTTNVTNNNLILSTTDLLKMIKGENG
jgi:hypothetical protein